jgi:hypothetical protein
MRAGRVVLALAAAGGRRTATASASTTAMATDTTMALVATLATVTTATSTAGGRQSARSTKGGGGLVSLLRATGGGEGRGGSEGGLGVECQLLQEIILRARGRMRMTWSASGASSSYRTSCSTPIGGSEQECSHRCTR